VKKAFEDGYQIIVVGKKEHPEIIGLKGQFDGKMEVILSPDLPESLDINRKTAVFAQTTISEEIFDCVVENLKRKFKNLKVHKTICSAVLRRKKEIEEFLKKIDTLIFVGGKNSSNTNALFEVCKKILPNSFFIEDEKEINIEWFKRSENIGISGSASTPKWLMEKVRTFLNDRLYKKVESK
ncbi:4-hydroxy-3-methylbut-2-enyl diphosphate reductase, partial [candidate division KSB1 bacterium]